MTYEIQLLRVSDAQEVDARLQPLSEKHLADFEQYWQPQLKSSREEDADWDWLKKNRLYSSLGNYEKYAIVCEQSSQHSRSTQVPGGGEYSVPVRWASQSGVRLWWFGGITCFTECLQVL